jgi:hypothetical protein
MPDRIPDPREEDIMAGDRRISRPDASLPDWEVPDSSYRPIPIVWFTGALILQMIAIYAVFVIFLSQNGFITIGLAAMITGMIGGWTWKRGMKDAGSGWRIATIIMLMSQLLLVIVAVSERI